MSTKEILRAVTLAGVAMTFSLPALAREHRIHADRGLGRPSVGRPGHSRGLLARLIFPCQAACAETARTCGDAANSEALTCVSDDCPAEIAAAQADCAEDRRADECRDAVGALAECADSCLDTRSEAIDVCRDLVMDCRDTCESDE